jgi:hypothetical protein
MPSNQLLAYRFDSGSSFEGQLVGALERIESGGAMRVLDALFVAREPDSGELVAVSLTADGRTGIIGRLLDFRLDPSKRAAATRSAVDGPVGAAVTAIGNDLTPGTAFAAVLVEHTWAQTLGDAIERLGGAETANEFIDASQLSEGAITLWPSSQP